MHVCAFSEVKDIERNDILRLADYVYEDTSGVITSPNFPLNYAADREVTYAIATPVGSTIQLVFTDFDVESDVFCRTAYVRVRQSGIFRSLCFTRILAAGILETRA